MSIPQFQQIPRRASSYLEVQIAMVMMSIGMMGLFSMSVVQSRQVAKLREILPASETTAINQADSDWARKLGVYSSLEDSVVPSAPVEPSNYDFLIDNVDGAPGFTTFRNPSDMYGWTSWNYSRNYLGNSHYHFSQGQLGSWAEFTASEMPAREYDVYITYPNLGSLGSAIVHEIFDGTTLIDTVTVNQTMPATGFTHKGHDWRPLGTYHVHSGSLRVRLTDGPGATSFIIADAILVRSVQRPVRVLSVTKTQQSATITVGPGT